MALGIDVTKDVLFSKHRGRAAVNRCKRRLRARLHGQRAAAPVSAVSHWLWPQEVNRTAHPEPRHFLAGLTIHLLMSLGWASGNALAVAAVRRSMSRRIGSHHDPGAARWVGYRDDHRGSGRRLLLCQSASHPSATCRSPTSRLCIFLAEPGSWCAVHVQVRVALSGTATAGGAGSAFRS